MSDVPPPPPPPPAAPPPPPMPSQPAGGAGAPKDYFVLALVGTILSVCTSCIGIITGIIAIVQNNKAKALYAAGDVAGANSAANTAKILVIVTWVLIGIAVLINLGLLATGSSPFMRMGN